MDSFLAVYAQQIKPCFKRSADEGDFYNSPLQQWGVDKSINYIDKDMMMVKGELINLANMSLAKELLTADYIRFKPYVNQMIFNESLLSGIPETVDSLHPDFFQGVSDYFSSSNAHKPSEEIYKIIMYRSLACISLEYQKRGLSLPEKSQLQSEISCQNKAQFNALLCVFRELYDATLKSGVLQKYLDQLADSIQQGQDNPPAACFFKINRKRTTEQGRESIALLEKTLKIEYTQSPWKTLLHRCKDKNNIDFTRPKPYFTFYEKHPCRPVLWASLLLQELDRHLHRNT